MINEHVYFKLIHVWVKASKQNGFKAYCSKATKEVGRPWDHSNRLKFLFNRRWFLKVHNHEFFFYFFCRSRILRVPRACNTIFLKIVFDSAEILDF
jgi:hypothetical protein